MGECLTHRCCDQQRHMAHRASYSCQAAAQQPHSLGRSCRQRSGSRQSPSQQTAGSTSCPSPAAAGMAQQHGHVQKHDKHVCRDQRQPLPTILMIMCKTNEIPVQAVWLRHTGSASGSCHAVNTWCLQPRAWGPAMHHQIISECCELRCSIEKGVCVCVMGAAMPCRATCSAAGHVSPGPHLREDIEADLATDGVGQVVLSKLRPQGLDHLLPEGEQAADRGSAAWLAHCTDSWQRWCARSWR